MGRERERERESSELKMVWLNFFVKILPLFFNFGRKSDDGFSAKKPKNDEKSLREEKMI